MVIADRVEALVDTPGVLAAIGYLCHEINAWEARL